MSFNVMAVVEDSFTIQSSLLVALNKNAFENTGKRRNASNQHFLPFPQFSTIHDQRYETLDLAV